jgi:hypothetical protein
MYVVLCTRVRTRVRTGGLPQQQHPPQQCPRSNCNDDDDDDDDDDDGGDDGGDNDDDDDDDSKAPAECTMVPRYSSTRSTRSRGMGPKNNSKNSEGVAVACGGASARFSASVSLLATGHSGCGRAGVGVLH